ncbi:SMP-30/gluconolactonase/LRE family protein [Mycetocola spongiae]|nr:SMP-30/gluconolactonase/LRE family protein [Mycetocola spongiae]
MNIDVLCDIKNHLGEGPLWDVEQQRLYWIDSKVGNIYRATADGRELRAWDVPGQIGSMALRRDGEGAVVSLDSGFHFLDLATGDTEFIVDPEPDRPVNRLNDGKVDRAGRFIVGSMHGTEDEASGRLYRLDPDLSVHVLDENIIVSNGPCWSPGGETFYFADSWSGEIWAYDYDLATGSVSNRRTFARIDADTIAAADGATVDSEGYLWSAHVFVGKIVRYAPDGTVDRVIDMPVQKVTSVMFGGANLDTLYVTSMAKRYKTRYPADGIQRGSIFAVTGLGVTGVPESRFGA